jgi:hypothetical protein
VRSTYQANSAVAVAQTVSDFITVMDSLKLGMKAVDEVRIFLCRSLQLLCGWRPGQHTSCAAQIFPLLRDLMNHLNLVCLPPKPAPLCVKDHGVECRLLYCSGCKHVAI